MKHFILTANTLLYALVRCGGTFLYGLFGEIEDQSQENLEHVVRLAQEELVQRDYADIDFDGDVTLHSDLQVALGACMDIDSVVAIAEKMPGGQRHFTIYREQQVIPIGNPTGLFWIMERAGKEYQLYQKTLEEFVSDIGLNHANISAADSEKGQADHFRLSSDVLQRNDPGAIRQSVADAGGSAKDAALILEALGETGNMLIIRQITCGEETNDREAVIFGESGLMQLEYTSDDGKVDFRTISPELFQQRLASLVALSKR